LFCKSAATIKELNPQAKIISIQNLIYWRESEFDVLKMFFKFAKDFNYYHLDRVLDAIDFVGFTYYMGQVASPWVLWSMEEANNGKTSDLGWPIYPDGLKEIIKILAEKYRKPLLILENGVADAHDSKRRDYILDHLRQVQEAKQLGFDVRGYFHWTLVDNFEWPHGYGPKFGLYAMNQQNRALLPKPSALVYRDIIQGALGT